MQKQIIISMTKLLIGNNWKTKIRKKGLVEREREKERVPHCHLKLVEERRKNVGKEQRENEIKLKKNESR